MGQSVAEGGRVKKRKVKILYSAISEKDLQDMVSSHEKAGWQRKSGGVIYDEKSRRWFFVMFLLS